MRISPQISNTSKISNLLFWPLQNLPRRIRSKSLFPLLLLPAIIIEMSRKMLIRILSLRIPLPGIYRQMSTDQINKIIPPISPSISSSKHLLIHFSRRQFNTYQNPRLMRQLFRVLNSKSFNRRTSFIIKCK